MKQYKKILYFIDGSLPSDEDFANAENMKDNVFFRNMNFIGDDHRVEECDFVYGCIPACYSEIPVAPLTTAEVVEAVEPGEEVTEVVEEVVAEVVPTRIVEKKKASVAWNPNS